MTVAPPLALLAEITHRCPMRCVYCSNPLALEPAGRELDTATWCRVFDEAADLGVLHVHFSGGEPSRDVAHLIVHAAGRRLYTNLITSGILLDRQTVADLAAAGLEHVQVSFQDIERAADRIGSLASAHDRTLAAARVREAGLALTLNFVIHRHNATRVAGMIDLAVRLGVAHAQYYGWALKNRAALMPTREQLEHTTAVVEAAWLRLRGRLVIDYVVPDYYARLPKACLGGWGRQFINIDPAGRVLPCHAATTIPGMVFATVHERSLEDIWIHSEAFGRFRGTAWMPEPCAGCERRELDWGGCRCQALALAGDAAASDPVCHKSPLHAAVDAIAAAEAGAAGDRFAYRGRTTPAPASSEG